MSRKHYQAIVSLCAVHKPGHLFVWALSAYLADSDPDFDRSRFIAACGPQRRCENG